MGILRLPEWRTNLYVLWFGSFMTELGNSMTLPFLALYIATLGNFSASNLNLLSGIAFAISYFAKTLVSPLWGRLADLKGRKLMCLRAAGVMTLTILANGFAPNVWWIIFFRMVQGSFSGYINNAQALIADSAPEHRKGSALGTLTTGSVTGGLLGPLVGGITADIFGYRMTFILAGMGMGIVFLTTLFFVREHFEVKEAKDLQKNGAGAFKIGWLGIIPAIYIVALTVQAASTTIQPIVSLFVKDLAPNAQNIALQSGFVTAAPGLSTMFVAPLFGKWIDKIGAKKILVWGIVGAAITIVPMLFTQTVLQLFIFRFIFGITDAAIIPAYQTLMAQSVPKAVFGRVFSYSQSFQAFGNVVGPLTGSMFANLYGYHSVFLITLVMEVICLLYIGIVRKRSA